jgi:MFS transporter, SP family, xylose:H+ symportor
MSLLPAWFVWRFVPETKGRRLEAIQSLWTKHPETTPAADQIKVSATAL